MPKRDLREKNMTITGRCYCGTIKYEISAKPETAFQCHCRECQYITGGNPNIVMVFPKEAFSYTSAAASTFSRVYLETPVTRHFCSNCGTGIGTESPARPHAMIVKVGTLDDPSTFEAKAAIFTCDMQPYHTLPEGMPSFDKRPPKK